MQSLKTCALMAALETREAIMLRVLRPMVAIMSPKSTECMVSSSVRQCQVLKSAMRRVIARPEVIVTERDLSKVKTRCRTVAVAMSMERSSPGLRLVGSSGKGGESLHHCV